MPVVFGFMFNLRSDNLLINENDDDDDDDDYIRDTGRISLHCIV